MAQAQYDKFIELRKSGVDAKTARTQAYGDIAKPDPVAPVAGVPPTPTPETISPTEAVNKQQLADNQSVRQEMIEQGKIPPVGTQAMPVTPVAPVESAPVTPIKETPVATDTTAQDQEKIQTESQAKMEQEKLKADLALQTEKSKAQASIPTSSTDIYNALVSGQAIAPQKTGAFREAQFKYSLYKRYNTMTPSQLVTSMKNGQIGSELSSMLAQNPNYIQARQQYEKEKQVGDINSSIRNIYNSSNSVVEEEEDPFVKITKDLINEFGYNQNQSSLTAFQQYVENDPTIQQYTTALSGTNQQIYETQTLLNNAVRDFSNQKGDMPISSFVIASESRFRTLNDTLSNLKGLKEVQQADLTMAAQMANAKYQAVSQDIAQANTQRNTIISQAIQAQFALAGQKAESELANEIARESMNDPYRAIPQMIASYQELGIPFQRSTQQIIADFESSGQDLGTFLTALQKTIQEKPEYQAMQDYQMRQYAPPVENTEYGFSNLGSGVIAVTNPKTGNVEFKSATGATLGTDASGNPVQLTSTSKTGTSLLDVADGTLIPTRLKALSPGNPGGKECGEYVNDVAGASLFGNTMEQKKSVANETTGGIGKAIVWAPTQSELYKKYGHVGVIVGEQGDNWEVRSSNLRADGRVTTDLVPKSASSNYKTLKNVSIQPVTTQETVKNDYSATDIRVFNSLTPSELSKRQNDPKFINFVETQNRLFSDTNTSMEDILKYSAGGDNIGETSVQQLSKFNQALSQVEGLKKSLEGQITDPIIGTLRSWNPYDANAQALKAELNSLIPNIARGVYGEVGVLTDQDIENYRKTLPNIKSTDDTNKLVLAMTMNTILNGYKGQLQTLAGAGKDVSKLGGKYKDYERRINQILTELGGTGGANSSIPAPVYQDFEADYNNL